MKFRTALKEARGLGAAKEGVAHWWDQRLTALILIPLSLWFVASLWALFPVRRLDLIDWLSSPITATLMILFIGSTVWHVKLGVAIIIEDYVETRWLRTSLLIGLTFLCWVLGVASTLSVLMLALAG